MDVIYLWNEKRQEGTIIDLVESHLMSLEGQANRIGTFTSDIGAFVKPLAVPFFLPNSLMPAKDFFDDYGVSAAEVEKVAAGWVEL